ncbi:MAG: ABC transporter permease, partial [Acidobacteriota bacterium]
MRELLQDLHYALRMLRKQLGFTIIALFTLALGIGANTAIFSVVNGVLLRPLPYPNPDQIVQVWESDELSGDLRSTISSHNLQDWRARTQTFQQITGYGYETFTLTGIDNPERINGVEVSGSLCSVLATNPALGRDFLPEEDSPGKKRVVILSHGFWQRRFGSDPALIGKT